VDFSLFLPLLFFFPSFLSLFILGKINPSPMPKDLATSEQRGQF
jgi:hypothetical protein